MDIRTYNECVHQWSDPLYRFACRCLSDSEEARDVVQTAFIALWEARDKVTPDKAKAWLFQVAYRQSVNAFRRQSRLVSTDVLTEDSFVAPAYQRPNRSLESAIDQLDNQARALVLLKDWEGYRYDEIGRITGLSETQVKVYLHRARKQLKTYLVSVENVLS